MAETRPFQLLYVSESAPGTGDAAMADIVAVSRQRNLACAISGALLFDGRRFCQLLEGSEAQVRTLMAHIAIDPRHRGLAIAAAGHFGLPRLTTRWRLGLCEPAVLDPLASGPLAEDEVALALFMSALAASAVT